MESLAQIRNFVKHPDDIVNKAKLFEAGVLKEGVQLGAKIVSVLVDYGEKMETTLLEMKAMICELDSELEKFKESGRLVEMKTTPSKTIPSSSLPTSEKKSKSLMKTPQSTKKGKQTDSRTEKGSSPGS